MFDPWFFAYGLPGKSTPRIPDERRIPLVAIGARDGETVAYVGPAMRMPRPKKTSFVALSELDRLPPMCSYEVDEFRLHLWRPHWAAAAVPRYVQRELEPTYV